MDESTRPQAAASTWMGRGSRRFAVVGPIVFALLGVLWLYRRLVAGWVLAGGDLHTYFFPYWAAAARAFQAGELPLWNPYLFAGAPLLANSQAGVFYPLNWPLWLLSGASLDGVTRALHWSVLLHLGLATVTTFVLARRLGVHPWGAALSGLIYAGGGFLGVHVEHLNQLQALAWLPLVLLPVMREARGRKQEARITNSELRIASIEHPASSIGYPASSSEHRASSIEHPASSNQQLASKIQNLTSKIGDVTFASPLSVFALAMILLAGHTQMAFIAVVGLVVWRIANCELRIANCELRIANRELRITFHVLRFILFFFPFGIAGLIAAAQLLPTVELSQFSVRSGGLPWREAVSFSVRPWELPRALMPPYILPPLLPEGVAYVGIAGLALAGWGAWRAVQRRHGYGIALIVLGGVGLFLALGGYNPLYLALVRLGVPGFAHFRAPSRFLTLTTLAASLLAGMGLASLTRPRGWRRYFVVMGIIGLAFGELWLAAERMPHASATDSRAYTDLRPATAHLVAQTRRDAETGQPPGRFLSISKTLFDAGDEVDIEAVYGAALSADALWAYTVAAKQREVLVPNLPLAFAVPAVDGYDGGVLPLRHYLDFSRLFLPEGTLDGRLRENLQAIPEGRWLSLLGARFLITDKTGDAWADDVFYDRQFQPALVDGDAISLAWLPADFEADALGLLYAGTGDVTATFADGSVTTLPLPVMGATDGVHRVRWDGAVPVTALTVRSTGDLILTGASLIDERTGAFYPLVLSERFRLVHSGDVKIYENLDVLSRAFLVHDRVCATSDEAALALMRDATFDPGSQVVLADCDERTVPTTSRTGTPVGESATLVQYDDARVVVDVALEASGWLLLADAWYPGWRAEVEPLDGDGEAFDADVLRADVLFRAVPVESGRWRVTFTYHSSWVAAGIGVSVAGLAVFLWYVYRWPRKALDISS